MTYADAYKLAMAAGWDAMVGAGGGEQGLEAARKAFQAMMAEHGFTNQEEGE